MSQEKIKVDPIMQQIGLLNLRVTDMMTQLNAVVKILMDENAALNKENSELRTISKSKS